MSIDFSWAIYFYCALGIAISVLLPILRALLPKPPVGLHGVSGSGVADAAASYVALGLFSLVGALLIVAASGDTLKDPRAALIAGYAWDSTLQKLKPFV
jgi:hypothetical protein